MGTAQNVRQHWRAHQGGQISKLEHPEGIGKAVLLAVEVPDRHPLEVGSDGILCAVLVVPFCFRLMVFRAGAPGVICNLMIVPAAAAKDQWKVQPG